MFAPTLLVVVACSPLSSLPRRYTQQGRAGLASLKGNDITRARLLQQLSEQTGAGVALVRARCHESGNAGDDEDYYSGAQDDGCFRTSPWVKCCFRTRPWVKWSARSKESSLLM